jgi:hypothetical protein
MTRVLRRPMFRMGGNTDQGIMSGVVPRQGYERPGLVDQLNIPELKKIAKEYAYQPRGVTPADALIEFGLNIASAEPRGSIFATAAESAKEPFQRYSKSKAESEAARYVSESDMFKTLIGAQADILGSEGGGKTYAQLEVADRVRTLTKNIMDNRTEIKKLEGQGDITGAPVPGGTSLNEDKIKELNEKIALDQSELGNLRKTNQYASSMLKSDTFRDNYIMALMEKLKKETLPDGTLKYKGDTDTRLYEDAYRQFLEFLATTDVRTFEATGGRVGYANAGPVMGQGMPTQMPTPADTMPEELGGITYEELRARLPQEVSDEVVRLLANSPEALEDFAVIQTEQDIANFNKKYGVNLVLPAEA